MKKSLLIFSFLVSSITVFGQEASSQKVGESWVISSMGSKISVSPTFPNPSTNPKGIRMSTGTYYGQAPIELLPGGDINLIAGYDGDGTIPATLSQGGSANINMRGAQTFLDTRKINLSSSSSTNEIEINATKPLTIKSVGELNIEPQGLTIDTYYAQIKATAGIALTSSVDITGNLYARNEKSYFRLNPSGQFFMFDSASTNNTYHQFTVPGLDVTNYKLFVQGGILAEEVRIQTNWADYVFDSDYKLKTLDEVEAYIHKNGHLPNVPSAKQVEKEGIELGDITRIQQEKIEELTLYTIAQEKKIKAQEERLAKLEALLLKE